MAKQLSKPGFGVTSTEVVDRIAVSDKCSALGAAQYRFRALMRELDGQFEAKASELREAFLIEAAQIQGD